MFLLNRRKYIVRRSSPQGALADIADATITVADSVPYTGTARYPAVTVVYDGATLAVNTHYTLSYVDNVELGAATVTVTGIGDFTGSVVKTFQIVSSGGGGGGSWADFDLSKLGDSVANATLRDTSAYYCGNENISLYGIQTLPDDSLFFAAQAQGHAYIWGFDDGHSFEVSHFKQTYTSRKSSVSNFKAAVLTGDGMVLYDSVSGSAYGGDGVYKTSLNAPYDLQASDSRTFIGNSNLLGMVPYRMQFSHDGSKLFYKGEYGKSLFCVGLSIPWNVSSTGAYTSFDLAGTQGIPVTISRIYAFQFSPDGKALVFTCENYIIKLSLSTAYDLSTASVHSYKHLSYGDKWWQGVAVNGAGTKMLLFEWNQNITTRIFYEYNLTT